MLINKIFKLQDMLVEKNSKEMEVSVIIPFWGSDDELSRALDALILQSLESFEVIVVIDSIDVKEETFLGIENSGIEFKKILNNERRGPLYSRMIGSLSAKGKYVWFMDHDDLVPQNFLELMVNQAKEFNVDIVECPIVIKDSKEQKWHLRFQKEQILAGPRVLDLFMTGGSYNNLFTKLITRRLWLRVANAIDWERSDPIIFAEDMLCTMVLYSLANSYKSFLGTHYCYVKRPTSTMGSSAPANVETSIRSLEWVLNEVGPIIQSYLGRKELREFLDREVKWSLDHISERLPSEISIELREKLGTMRKLYNLT